MTVEQLKIIRDSYMVETTRSDGKTSTRAEYMKISLDGGIDVVTSKDLVVFDDENEIVHAVCINEDMRTQSMFPVKLISSDYSMIQQVEGIMSQKDFEEFLEEGYINSLISNDKKELMIKWTRAIKNQAQQPIDTEPFFKKEDEPIIIPKGETLIKRKETK